MTPTWGASDLHRSSATPSGQNSPSQSPSSPGPVGQGPDIGWITDVTASIVDRWPQGCTPSPLCLMPRDPGDAILAVTFGVQSGHDASSLLGMPITVTSGDGATHTLDSAGFTQVDGDQVNFMLFAVAVGETDFTLNWSGYPSIELALD